VPNARLSLRMYIAYLSVDLMSFPPTNIKTKNMAAVTTWNSIRLTGKKGCSITILLLVTTN